MAFLRSLGNVLQRALFTTTFTEIEDHLEQVRKRLEDLEKKVDDRVKGLETQIRASAEGRAPSA
jgi:chaperonin cofactor prefoldin